MKSKEHIFRQTIKKTIKRPDFLSDPNNSFSTKSLTWTLTYSILTLFNDVIGNEIVSNPKLNYISKLIMDSSEELSKFIDDKELLYIWLFIGELVDEWIELAEEQEQYESCANLKNLMKKCFAD